MPFVNYQVEMTPENAKLIDEINRLVLGDSYTEETPAKTTKAADKPKSDTKAATKTEAEKAGTDGDDMTMTQFKAVVKKAKAEHGEEFCKTTLEEAGASAGPLGRMVSSLDADDYATTAEALEAGPAEKADEPEDDDDGLDDDEDDASEVDAEAVKKAAKAYAKEVGRDEAKEIMNKHGAATLTKIDDCSEKQLQAMFKEFTA